MLGVFIPTSAQDSAQAAAVSLATLAARAAMLEERFEESWEPVETAEGRARADKLWARWETLLPGGGEAALAERLRLARWTEAGVRLRLGEGRWRAGAALPEWTRVWAAVRERLRVNAESVALGGEAADGEADDGMATWRRFFGAWIDEAENRWKAEGRERRGEVEPVVAAEFRRLLGTRLGIVARPVLEFEFGVWSEARRGAADWFGGEEAGKNSRAEFAAELARSGAALLERSYPVLLRQVCEQAVQMSAAWAEFVARLTADAAGLSERFGEGRSLGQVVACRGGLSDPHRGARSGVELRFANGVRLIYKPRPMALEAGYFSLAAWIETRGVGMELGSVRVWDRGDYGWMEWIEAAPCASEAGARRHFRRTGAHLALLQVLGGADFHSENWIAAGEFPLPIDLEVLMRPTAPGIAGELEQSVLGVGLLPVWQASGGRVANISALGEGARGGGDAERGAHRAVLAGRVLAADDFVDEIVEGFAAMQRALRRNRAGLSSARGPLATLRRARLRHVARPTEIYGRLLGVATQPRALTDGAVCSIELERLTKALAGVPAGEVDKLARMIAAEQRALAKLDVPLLHGRVDGLGLETGEGREITRFFVVSGWTACRRRLAALSEAETRKQAGLIRSAFAVARLGKVDTPMTAAKRAAKANANARGAVGRPATSAALLAAARAIGRELAAQAVEIDGGVTWVAPQMLPRVERFQLSMLNLGLYDGVAGVGLFLAALYRATGEAEWARLGRAALTPIVKGLSEPAARRHVRRMPAGIGLGRGGLVYALTHAADWLRKPVWLAREQRLVELLKPQAGEAEWDVMSGAAGAILSALRLAEATDDAEATKVATEWGRRLVAAQEPMPEGGGAWRHEGAALGGMAHGAAGIGAALARLAAVTGEEAFRRAAEEARAFEGTLFVPERSNWLDLRGARDLAEARRMGRCGLAWCHGAPGILLARLTGLQSLDTAEVRAEIAAALGTIENAAAGEIDQCCCGEAGVIDILASAAATLGRAELMDTARRRAAVLLAKARASGGYNAYGATALPAGPGFFQGLAGVGYTWLRLAQPERFPSVLAFA